MRDKIIAIIPCRKGSKRLKNKNRKEFCGMPLYQWTLDQAIKCKFIDEIIVSSDDPIIKKEVEGFRKHKPYDIIKFIERPPELATDTAKSEDVILHTLEGYNGFTIVILLQVTSPLRETIDIEDCIFRFFRNKGCIVSIFKEDDLHYKLNGAIFIDTLINLRVNKSFIPKQFYIMPKERSVDIDDINDFRQAEKIMKKRLRNGK